MAIPRIAVYDSSPTNLKLFDEVLSKKGFEVVALQHKLESINEVEHLKPDLLILAYLVGYDEQELEVVRAVHKTQTRLPVLICTTGIRALEERHWGSGYSRVGLLPKPFAVGDLLTAVYKMLSLCIVFSAVSN